MQETAIRIDIFTFIIFLGVIQGLFLSYFFLNKKLRKRPSTFYLGMLMLVLALIILEIFMNHTGYMLQVIRLDNYSEPLSFAVAPLMYFYIHSTIKKQQQGRVWLHMIPFIFWAVYCILYFIQPLELKIPHYMHYHYPEAKVVLPEEPYPTDPLYLRRYVNELVMVQLASYLIACIIIIKNAFKKLGKSFFASHVKPLSWLRNFMLFMILILLTFIFVKKIFHADLGDYLVGSLISLVIYATSFNIIRRSDFFQESVSDALHPKHKYQKSSLQDVEKALILNGIKKSMEEDHDYKNHLVSLTFISKKLNIPVHHISQVINEKLDQNFFDMIAHYRINEAKKILSDPDQNQLTIEDVADEVGYNSKSAFNRSFKKLTGKTPSQFRDNPK